MTKCLKCGTEMVCYDDIVYQTCRIDWLKCPECGSKAEIEYNPCTNEMIGFKWERK